MAKTLLVEDNETNRICFQASYPQVNNEVFIAVDGAEGVSMAIAKYQI
jgi:CheY-like chemotaxis protein